VQCSAHYGSTEAPVCRASSSHPDTNIFADAAGDSASRYSVAPPPGAHRCPARSIRGSTGFIIQTRQCSVHPTESLKPPCPLHEPRGISECSSPRGGPSNLHSTKRFLVPAFETSVASNVGSHSDRYELPAGWGKIALGARDGTSPTQSRDASPSFNFDQAILKHAEIPKRRLATSVADLDGLEATAECLLSIPFGQGLPRSGSGTGTLPGWMPKLSEA